MATTKNASASDLALGSNRTVFRFAPEDVVIIGLDTKHKEGEHPLWDERIALPINQAIVDNLVENGWEGVIRGRMEGKSVVVVNGRQSIRAAREANKIRLEKGLDPIEALVEVKNLSDEDAMALMIQFNEMRAEDDTLTKARKAYRFMALGKTKEATALRFGVAPTTIDMWGNLLKLHSDVQAMIRSGQIGAKAASRLAVLNPDNQVAAARKLLAAGQATTAGAEQMVRNVKAAVTEAAKPPSNPPAAVDGAGEAPDSDPAIVIPQVGYSRPTMDTLRKVHRAVSKHQGNLPLQARLLLAWVIGEGPAEDVEGLADVLRTLKHRGRAPTLESLAAQLPARQRAE